MTTAILVSEAGAAGTMAEEESPSGKSIIKIDTNKAENIGFKPPPLLEKITNPKARQCSDTFPRRELNMRIMKQVENV